MFRSLARLARCLGIAAGLGTCQAAGNIDPAALDTDSKDKALILFTVTHDWGPPFALLGIKTESFGAAANVHLDVEFHGAPLEGGKISVASMPPQNPLGGNASVFDKLWGQYYVRELPPGRYELTTWKLTQIIQAGSLQIITPKLQPPALSFEVAAGSVTYIGNIHAELTWGKSLIGMQLMTDGLIVIRNEAERDLELIIKTYPQLRQRVTVAPLRAGPWIAAPRD
jgi:hypothetical protein